MSKVVVLGVNLKRRLMLLDTDEIVPIAFMYDEDGDKTEDHAAALICGGWMQDGRLITVDFSGFTQPERMH